MKDELELFPIFLDKLGERLVFERIATGLYDALARKRRLLRCTGYSLATIERFQDEELGHIRLLERWIRLLGGKVSAQTSSAGLISTTSVGFQKVVLDSGISFFDSLEAMLIAEMADSIGWDLLIVLAQKIGLDELTWEFRGALNEEREHFRTIQQWAAEVALQKGEISRLA